MTLTISLLLQYRNRQPWYEEWLYIILNSPILWAIVTLAILYVIFKRNKKDFHSHWNTLIPNFKYLSRDFYAELKKELHAHEIKGIRTSFVSLKEGGVTSSRRLYLRVEWKSYQYDMCCAPFGDGLFLSSWLVYKTSIGQILVNRIPFIGGWLVRRFYKVTYYKIDTASMFMTYCHNSMLKVADDITKESGIRIDDADRKPILKDIFKR